MQKIEDALAQKQKDLDDKSAELDKASQEVKDLKAKVEQKDKDIQDKDKEIKDLKGAPGSATQEDVKPEVDNVDSGEIYNALKQIF